VESRSTFRAVVYVFLFLVLVLAAVVATLIRVEATNRRQDATDRAVQENTDRIARVQYTTCVNLNEGIARQNVIIDAEIARREAVPNPDEKGIQQLKDFRLSEQDCGSKPG
jgi:hypothetical protein